MAALASGWHGGQSGSAHYLFHKGTFRFHAYVLTR